MVKFRPLEGVVIESPCSGGQGPDNPRIWMLIFEVAYLQSEGALGRLITNAANIPRWYVPIAPVSAFAVLARGVVLHRTHVEFRLTSSEGVDRAL